MVVDCFPIKTWLRLRPPSASSSDGFHQYLIYNVQGNVENGKLLYVLREHRGKSPDCSYKKRQNKLIGGMENMMKCCSSERLEVFLGPTQRRPPTEGRSEHFPWREQRWERRRIRKAVFGRIWAVDLTVFRTLCPLYSVH